MLVGFVGDVHGLAFYVIALIATWQRVANKKLDIIVQVGDMGAYPSPERMDESSQRNMALDPAQADFSRLLQADGLRAERLRAIRKEFASPIHFLRGNHEDFRYLNELPREPGGTAKVDDFDLLRYVPDGTVLQEGDLRIAFFGGIETKEPDPRSIDPGAYELLMDMGPGSFDILATHDPPYGVGVGYRGQVAGSRVVTALIEHTQPALHISGHLHHLNGPRSYGRSWSWSLDGLISSVLWHPEDNGFRMGCLAVLDTDTWFLQPITDRWLHELDTRAFDFDSWYESFARAKVKDTVQKPPKPSERAGHLTLC